MLKYNFQKRKYERVEDRFGLDSMCLDDLLSPDDVKVFQKACANCGGDLAEGKTHTSIQWKDDMEFVCKVCDACHEIELVEQTKYPASDTLQNK